MVSTHLKDSQIIWIIPPRIGVKINNRKNHHLVVHYPTMKLGVVVGGIPKDIVVRRYI